MDIVAIHRQDLSGQVCAGKIDFRLIPTLPDLPVYIGLAKNELAVDFVTTSSMLDRRAYGVIFEFLGEMP